MKIHALVLCAALWASGLGAVATAQGTPVSQPAGATGALGKAQVVDETALAIGDTPADQARPGASASGQNTFVYFLRMILVLALVLVAIWLVFRLLKKAQRPKQGSESLIKVYATSSLGAGKAVHVIGLGEKAWLVGSAENSVSLISAIDDKELLDQLALEEATRPVQSRGDFSAILSSLLGRKGGSRSSAVPGGLAEPGPDFLARARDRLKKY